MVTIFYHLQKFVSNCGLYLVKKYNVFISFVLSEENVWKMCEDVSTRLPSELLHCYVVFVSNKARTIPLWRQRAGETEDKLVIYVSQTFLS